MGERIDFSFVGGTSFPLSLDPDEFKGMTVAKIENTILKMLHDIAPGVSFFNDDIALAAVALTGVGVTAQE